MKDSKKLEDSNANINNSLEEDFLSHLKALKKQK